MILSFFEKVTDKVFSFLDKVLSKLGLIGDSTLRVMFGNPFKKVKQADRFEYLKTKKEEENHMLDSLRYDTVIWNPKNDFKPEKIERKDFQWDRKADNSSKENNSGHSGELQSLDKSTTELLSLELELSISYPSSKERVFYHVEYDRIFISNTSYDKDGLGFVYLGEI